MKAKTIDTYECRIYIGSIYEDTKAHFYERNLTKYIGDYQNSVDAIVPLRVTKTAFVCGPKYLEDGWEIAAINYPRAGTNMEIIEGFMEGLAEGLLERFCQKRVTLVTPHVSIMYESEASYMPQVAS
tara:strand:- start:43436 stop:43816 length:381 start_codon:yes stop_codon:yes gene_type:complete